MFLQHVVDSRFERGKKTNVVYYVTLSFLGGPCAIAKKKLFFVCNDFVPAWPSDEA